MNDWNEMMGLYTDLYELTMAQGYFFSGKKDESAAFEYFFRDNPFHGGYVIFAGLGDLLEAIKNFAFSGEEIKYLKEHGFKDDFLQYLSEFRFKGTLNSVSEGEVVFPLEPVVRVKGNIIECQVIETLLLNFLNFESLIATKASRIRLVAGKRTISDFGLRRAQGLGGLQASRAAIIGGVDATSNVLAGYRYDVKITGTQAHSWIQSFDDELTAFRKYAELYPENTVLLVDTYDSINRGIPNAIQVGHELKEKGYKLQAIRLDSGDLAYFSKKARKMLDDAELYDTKILVSNQLDEYVIRSLLEQGAPIDGFGVGTELITGKNSAALDGVYKLVMSNNEPSLKLSDTYQKISLPGLKKVIRYYNGYDQFYADCIAMTDEDDPGLMVHPYELEKSCKLRGLKKEFLHRKVFEKGDVLIDMKTPDEISKFSMNRLGMLPAEHKRFEVPHIYKVGITEKLNNVRTKLVRKLRAQS